MKAISVRQPLASAIVIGAKRIETRSWITNYRGPLLIHASKRCIKSELLYFQCCWNWCSALAPLGLAMGNGVDLEDILPFGAIIGSVDVMDCRKTETITIAELAPPVPECGWTEEQLGNYSLGRYGWFLANPRRFETAIPYSGRQGFFDVPEKVIKRAMETENV